MKASMKAQSISPGAAPVPEGEFLSAWLDGEVEPESGQGVARDLSANAAWRRRVEDWTWVGDALRSEEVAALHSPRLCARIVRALDAEPALLAPQALVGTVETARRGTSRWSRRAASVGAVAAAAAVLMFIAVPMVRDGGRGFPADGTTLASSTVSTMASATTVKATSGGTPNRSAMPVSTRQPDSPQALAMDGMDTQAIRPASFDPGWSPYLDAHRDYAGFGLMSATDVLQQPNGMNPR